MEHDLISNSAVFLENKDKNDDRVKVTKADAERICSKIELSDNIFCSEGWRSIQSRYSRG